MKPSLVAILADLAAHCDLIRNRAKLDWPIAIDETINRLLFDLLAMPDSNEQLHDRRPAASPILAAIVGGASSGKSTIFNNLVTGEQTSRITAKGHATLGPILAAHAAHREMLTRWLDDRVLFPGLQHATIDLGAAVVGQPDSIFVAFHEDDRLRNVLLVDLPDFTSHAAQTEGDVALRLLPWFDRLIVVIDSERWFDRQAGPILRQHAQRFGQPTFVVFNRTQEGPIAESQQRTLHAQADRLAAQGTCVLDFRRGRGLCLFPPSTWDPMLRFLESNIDRRTNLTRYLSAVANKACNQNEERLARLDELARQLADIPEQQIPTIAELMVALMTPAERRNLDVVWRIFRANDLRRWLSTPLHWITRLAGFAQQLPASPQSLEGSQIRLAQARTLRETTLSRLARGAFQMARASRFWDEVHAWTGQEPVPVRPASNVEVDDSLRECAEEFDRAMKAWQSKVESECKGASPHITGAALAGAVGVMVVLVAVPGPVAALTMVTAKGALLSALSHLAAFSGAGALFGRPLGRLWQIAQEKLVGTAEFQAVLAATKKLRGLLRHEASMLVEQVLAEARTLTIDRAHIAYEALSCATDIQDQTFSRGAR